MSRLALLVICFLVLISFIAGFPVEHELVEENRENTDLDHVVRAPALEARRVILKQIKTVTIFEISTFSP